MIKYKLKNFKNSSYFIILIFFLKDYKNFAFSKKTSSAIFIFIFNFFTNFKYILN
jgi:hypothetical protein